MPMKPSEHDQVHESPFHGSPHPSLGVELELQIVDRESGELVPGAEHILDVCKEEKVTGVGAEFLLSMIEAKTGICQNTSDVEASLIPLLRRLKNTAHAVGYGLAVGGTHPFSRGCKNAVSPGDRYHRMRRLHGWLAYQEAIFGLHVHVGVPDAEQALGVMNMLVALLPHLLALSANSPFWEGLDSEFASARVARFHPSPHAGMPMYFSDWRKFSYYFDVMSRSRIYSSFKDLHWDLRPRPDFGTLEFRIFDAPGSILDLLSLVSLVRCLVISARRQLEANPKLGQCGPDTIWPAAENTYGSAALGLHAVCM